MNLADLPFTDNDLIGEPGVAMPDITAKENENKLFSFGGNKATREISDM